MMGMYIYIFGSEVSISFYEIPKVICDPEVNGSAQVITKIVSRECLYSGKEQ